MLERGKLEIEMSPDLVTGFQLPPAIMNGNWLMLTLITADEYTPRYETESKTIRTFNGTYPIVGPSMYSFDFTLKDPRDNIYKALELQAKRATSTVKPGSLIQYLTVRDYCNPDPEDVLAVYPNRAFTTRLGLMYKSDYQRKGSWYDSNKQSNESYPGITWTFRQYELLR